MTRNPSKIKPVITLPLVGWNSDITAEKVGNTKGKKRHCFVYNILQIVFLLYIIAVPYCITKIYFL